MTKEEFKKETFELLTQHLKIDCVRGITIDISVFTDKIWEIYSIERRT
jgi:hypothetical protein